MIGEKKKIFKRKDKIEDKNILKNIEIMVWFIIEQVRKLLLKNKERDWWQFEI